MIYIKVRVIKVSGLLHSCSLAHASSACACSAIGSLDQSCDRVSGQCNCKTKVTGRNCTLCEVTIFLRIFC